MKKILSIIAIFVFVNFNAQTSNFSYTLTNNTITAVYTPTAAGVYSVQWAFGDGITTTLSTTSYSITHIYPLINSAYRFSGNVFLNNSNVDWLSDSIFVYTPGCSLVAVTSDSFITNSPPQVAFSSAVTGQTNTIQYKWKFYDGDSATTANATRTFTMNGPMIYTLTVTENATCTAICKRDDLVQSVPLAGFNSTLLASTPSLGLVNFSVTNFYKNCSSFWDFGDGNLKPAGPWGPAASHTYFNGTYNYTVISYVNYVPFTFNGVVTVTDNPCVLNSNFSYTAATNGQIDFSASAAPTATMTLYNWDFGDGTSSNLASPSHTYQSAGSYSVTLTVSNSLNPVSCTQSTSTVVVVSGIPCNPIITYSFYPVPFQPHFYFLKINYPYNLTAWSFDWGDGSTDNFTWGTHTYSAAGMYTICITATASCGSTTTSCVAQAISKGTDNTIYQVTVIGPNGAAGVALQSEKEAEISVYPNPATDRVFISAPTTIESAQIYNLLGESCLSVNLKDTEQKQIDISTLPNGIYYLKITSNKKSSLKKLVIER